MQWKERWLDFLSDESGGERDTLTTLLILALIIIPLVVVIIVFKDRILDFARSRWNDVFRGGA